MTNIYKQWKELEKGASISLDNWEELKDFIWKMQLRIEDLEKSRENWKLKYEKLKNENGKTRSI